MRAWLGAALVVSLATAARAADDELKLPPVTRVTLENGLRVMVAEYHELPLVEFHLMIGAGAAQDPTGREGLAMLTASSLRRGAGRRSAVEVAQAVESLGGSLAAEAGYDATIVSAEFLSDDVGEGLGLLRDVLLAPTFPRDEVRRARDEQRAGITAALEQPAAVAERCFAAFLYGPHPYGRPVDGRPTTVATLGRSDVRAFYDRWYRPNNTILALVGDVRAEDALARLREAFGSWPARPDAVPIRAAAPARLTARRVLLVDKPDATQTQIRFGNYALKRASPDLVAAQVGNTILGGGFSSVLIEELRIKRSLTYSAGSQFVARLTAGDFRVSTFTKSPTTAETLTLALEVVGRFREATPDAKALAKAKAYLRGQFPLRLETPNALAARLCEIEFFGLPGDELETYRGRVAAVTPFTAHTVAARDIPAPATMAVVVVGKATEIRAPLEAALGPVTVMAPAACDELAGAAAR